MRSDPAIRADSLRVVRGARTVLADFSCTVSRGEVTGLLGPSGSGKSTLMRAMVGTQIVASGTIEVLGLPAGDAALRRKVAYMTQSASVYRDISVTDNVRYFARLASAGNARVREVIEQVGLPGERRQLAGNLSGGQLSRVSLACALVADPQVLILDEPTVGQDPALRRELWADFRARAAAGTTLLVSSHVMDEAARCDRILLLREGTLVADDTPANILAATGTPDFDAAFLAIIDADMERPPSTNGPGGRHAARSDS